MANVVIIGTQWGDEGKGKIVDLADPVRRLYCPFPGRQQRRAHPGVEGKKYIIPSHSFGDPL